MSKTTELMLKVGARWHGTRGKWSLSHSAAHNLVAAIEASARALAAIPAEEQAPPGFAWVLVNGKRMLARMGASGSLTVSYAAPTPPTAPAQDAQEVVTVDSIRAAGGIVHSDGNIFFTNIDKLRAALRASSPADTRDPRCSGCDIANGHPEFCRRQHSRIEADEALMRQLLDALKDLVETAEKVDGWQSFPDRPIEEGWGAITALRKRLESSNAS